MRSQALLHRARERRASTQSGATAIRNLEQALLRWEAGGDAERHAFMQMATGYVAGYRKHMRLEESELMPLAERTLSAQDWVDVERRSPATPTRWPGQRADRPRRAVPPHRLHRAAAHRAGGGGVA
jgi:hypothetical protein